MLLVQIIVLLVILFLLTRPSRLSGLKSVAGRIFLLALLVAVTMLHPLLGILFAVLIVRIPEVETLVTDPKPKSSKNKKTRFEVENRMKRPQDSNQLHASRPRSLPPTIDSTEPTEVHAYHKTKSTVSNVN